MTDPIAKRDRPVNAVGVGSPASDSGATSLGRTVIADAVVAKIAGIAAREIGGVRDVVGGGSRMVGRLRDTVPGAFSGTTHGVSVEVGTSEAAVDVGIVAYYGVALHELAAAVRRNVIVAIERMTGLAVTEVNVTVHDVYVEDDESDVELSRSRVR